MRTELKRLLLIVGAFLACFYLPVGVSRFDNAVFEALALVKWYAREHVLLCLVPAFFIAGAIAEFVSKGSVIRYLGAGANKVVAYSVAAVSGTILAVCSCTVLPLFAGIYRMGAGIGPATAFLYSGPAINVLAILMTARVLGLELGIARAVGAVLFSVLIGFAMHLLFRHEEHARSGPQEELPNETNDRPLWKNALVMAIMVGVLVSANWSVSGRFTFGVACCPGPDALRIETVTGIEGGSYSDFVAIQHDDGSTRKIARNLIRWQNPVENPIYTGIHRFRFLIAVALLIALASALKGWYQRAELTGWVESSWRFARQILPLLFFGVLLAGLLLGRVGHEGLIPSEWVSAAVGGNSLRANFCAAFAAAFMYFATLTEVPILQGLIANGMGKGPALALLLAGPALSLPNMLVIYSVLGGRRTVAFVGLVIIAATIMGMLFGILFG